MIGLQLDLSTEHQNWEMGKPVGQEGVGKEEEIDPDLTHESSPSLQTNVEKRRDV